LGDSTAPCFSRRPRTSWACAAGTASSIRPGRVPRARAGAAIADGTIDRGHRVVVIGTSSGLKDPLAGLDAASPAAVSATLETTLAYVGAQR
ncbi:MAG: hypothetical protein ACHQEA_07420, partial [Gaiellales bacterium]